MTDPFTHARVLLALQAEVDRLRKELDYLNNQRRLDNGDLARAYDEGRDNERAATVAWLRDEDEKWLDGEAPLLLLAREIERGEHRREEKP